MLNIVLYALIIISGVIIGTCVFRMLRRTWTRDEH